MVPGHSWSALNVQPSPEDDRCVASSMADRTHEETGNERSVVDQCGQSASQPLVAVDPAHRSDPKIRY